jgi:hypothetical protein
MLSFALRDGLQSSLSGWQRAASWLVQLAKGPGEAKPFTDEELEQIEKIWRGLLARYDIFFDRIERKPGELSIALPGDGSLKVDHKSVSYQNETEEEDDNLIRACLEFFRKQWPTGAAELDGPEAFKLKSWIQAQIAGVEIAGYRPPEAQLKTLKITIETDELDPDNQIKLQQWATAKIFGGRPGRFKPTRKQLNGLRITVQLKAKRPERAADAATRPARDLH